MNTSTITTFSIKLTYNTQVMSPTSQQTAYEYHYYQNRENIFKVNDKLPAHLNSRTGVGLLKIIIGTPAELRRTKQHEDQRTQRKQQIAYEKILAVHNATLSDKMNILKHIKAEYTRDARDQHDEPVYVNCLL